MIKRGITPLALCPKCGTLSLVLTPSGEELLKRIKSNGGTYKTIVTQSGLCKWKYSYLPEDESTMKDTLLKNLKKKGFSGVSRKFLDGEYVDYKYFYDSIFSDSYKIIDVTNIRYEDSSFVYGHSIEGNILIEHELKIRKPFDIIPSILINDNFSNINKKISIFCPCCKNQTMGWEFSDGELQQKCFLDGSFKNFFKENWLSQSEYCDYIIEGSSFCNEVHTAYQEYRDADRNEKKYHIYKNKKADAIEKILHLKQDFSFEEFITALARYDYINSLKEDDAEKIKTKVSKMVEKCNNLPADKVAIDCKPNTVELILNLLNLNKDIIFITDRLKALYKTQLICQRDFHSNIIKNEFRKKQLELDIESKIKVLNCNISEDEVVRYFSLVSPKKPGNNAIKPIEPIYVKPGLFNKKRVLAENEAKRQKYEKDIELYNIAVQEYNSQMEEYEIACAEYNKIFDAKKLNWN